MSTILAYTSPALGHLYPMMPVLLELQRRGHVVHVRTLPSLVEQVRAAGLAAGPIDERLHGIADKYPEWEATTPKQVLQCAANLFFDRGRIDGPDLLQTIEEVGPDVLLVDTNAWGALAAAEASGIPFVHFAPYLVPIPARGVPPYGPGLRRMDNPVGRVRDWLVGTLVGGAVVKEFMPRFDRLRAQHGLAPAASYEDIVATGDRILVTSSEPFDYPRPDWPAKARRVGALDWEPHATVSSWLDELAEDVVLVNTSSEYQADEDLARTAIAAFAGQPEQVLVTMPAGIPDDLGGLPTNVRVEQFVPHSLVLPRTSVVVNHGGMGSTQKALGLGIPVCVVPFGRDQHETAARVVHADAGVRLSRRRLSPERLREAVRSARGKQEGARRCADGFAAAGGAMAAADVVEELLV